MIKLILIISIFVAVSSGITYLLYKITNKWWVKYLPAIIPLIIILSAIFTLLFSPTKEGFKDLATFAIVILFLPSLLAIITTGAIIDYQRIKLIKEKNKKENQE